MGLRRIHDPTREAEHERVVIAGAEGAELGVARDGDALRHRALDAHQAEHVGRESAERDPTL